MLEDNAPGFARALVERALKTQRNYYLTESITHDVTRDYHADLDAIRAEADALDARLAPPDLETVLNYLLRGRTIYAGQTHPPHIEAALRLREWLDGDAAPADASMSLCDRQAITQDALRAAGFEKKDGYANTTRWVLFWKDPPAERVIAVTFSAGEPAYVHAADSSHYVSFPRIATMRDLAELYRLMAGKPLPEVRE